jgi:hypothetical protein
MEKTLVGRADDFCTILAIWKIYPSSRSVNNVIQRLDLDPHSIKVLASQSSAQIGVLDTALAMSLGSATLTCCNRSANKEQTNKTHRKATISVTNFVYMLFHEKINGHMHIYVYIHVVHNRILRLFMEMGPPRGSPNNGRACTILRFDEERDRYEVDFGSHGRKFAKWDNLAMSGNLRPFLNDGYLNNC